MTASPYPAIDRRAAYVMAAIGTAVLVLGGLILVPWDWVPGGELVPMPAEQLFTTDEIARAEAYNSAQRALSWTSAAVSLAVALALGLSQWGARLVRRLARGRRWWISVPIGTAAILTIGRVCTLPFALLMRDRNLEYGLTNQPLTGWLIDRGKGLLVAWLTTTLIVLVLVGTARRFPRRWFVLAGTLAAVMTMAGSFLYPVLVEPLFNDFRAMPQGPFRSSVISLADRQGVSVNQVLIADASRRTTTLNAYVSGFGETRRVVVYDTLLKRLSPEEARIVIAHELAHARNHDVLVGTLLGAAACLVVAPLFGLALASPRLRARAAVWGPQDPAVVALVLALAAAGSLLSSPFANAVSRAVEARADRAALVSTNGSEAFVEMQRELALASIHDPTPPTWSHFWFGSHPTVLQRTGLVASLAEAR